jgi:proteasome accessory factor A
VRERVFGIETEYALIYHPGRGETSRPTNLQIYGLLERALDRRLASLPRALSLLRAKAGRFLENGMSFHYEATPEAFEHGLLEVASPECRDPMTLLACERAKDELVEELAVAVNEALRGLGYRGRLRVGKNNVDSLGHTFGSHESYWVEDHLSGRARATLLALWLPLWLLTLPVLLWVVLLTPALVLLSLAALLGYALLGGVAAVAAHALGAVRRQWRRRIESWTEVAHAWLLERGRRIAAEPGRLVGRLNRLVWPLFPLLELHSLLIGRFVLRALREDLTAFLVTRTVFTGAGAVAFDGGPLLRLAQRPPFLRALARIFTSGERRPVYELRDPFFRPLEVFADRRRLHLMIGDANLCEWAQLLRVGTCALVLEALEAGGGGFPRLADPLDALRRLNLDAAAELALADGTRASALAIQRRYLTETRRLLGAEVQRVAWKERVLRDWATTLELLERDPAALADRLDWVAKRTLLEAEVAEPADREALRRHGASLLAGPPPEEPELRRLRELAFRARRLDLRYHELGPRGGYRRLLRRGRVRALVPEEAVARARREPPSDTRAGARGRAIREARARGLSGAASWQRVRAGLLGWRFFPDPLAAAAESPRGGAALESAREGEP